MLPQFKDLSRQEKRECRKNYRQGYLPAMVTNIDLINKLRDALIRVAKLGGKIY
jgi:hypothetical protein